MKKYFDILGLEENSTYEEVKLARVNLLKKYHPDLLVGKPEYAKKKTEEVNEAFEKLKMFFEDKNVTPEKTHLSNSTEVIDKRIYEEDAKDRALEKLKEKVKDKKFNNKKLLDVAIIVLFSIIIILFFILIFS